MKIIKDVNALIVQMAPEEFKKDWVCDVMAGKVAFGSAYNNWATSVPFMKKAGISFKDIIDHCNQEDQKSLANMAVSNLGLRNQVEGRELGLRFEIIDPVRVPKVAISDATRLALLGCIAFFFLLPVAGTGVAAYDLRIYDADDLKRLGLQPFGHVPPFRGYRQGTLSDRLRRRTGASC